MRRKARGFTLLELLLSLAVLGLISALSYPGIQTVVEGWRRVGTHGDAAYRIAMAEAFVRQALEQSLPTTVAGLPAAQFHVSGDASAFEFTSVLPRQRRFPGVYVTRLAFEASPRRQALVMAYAAARSSSIPAAASPRTRQILEHLSRGTFAYYDARQQAWSDVWTDRQYLPDLVRIRFAAQPGGQRDWLIALRSRGIVTHAPAP